MSTKRFKQEVNKTAQQQIQEIISQVEVLLQSAMAIADEHVVSFSFHGQNYSPAKKVDGHWSSQNEGGNDWESSNR